MFSTFNCGDIESRYLEHLSSPIKAAIIYFLVFGNLSSVN